MKTIIAVAECGSIGRAAVRLGQSQAGVSGNVRRIEKYFGGELFHRSAEGVRTTPLGDWVLVKARALAADMDKLVSSARSVAGGTERLRIAGQPCSTMLALIPLLPRDVEVRVDHSADWLLQQLKAGLLDVCVTAEPAGFTKPDGVHSQVITDEPCVVGLSRLHPLAAKPRIDLVELSDADWVDSPFGNSGLRLACQQAGFEPRVRYWIADPGAAHLVVRSGRAVGLFTRGDGIVLRPLEGNPVSRRTVLYWRAPASSLIRRLTNVTVNNRTESRF
ncbi:LysR family transcriptional regulator [Kibdelosporangium philippinense]|uniref:LysR family transcriptional regulator n=1 Tax=Kibdelosporangium philippinense TaxID=211113 RepID=A0ABS8ZSL1_9PSEU|nr:LysR family transcriptional regulator [Kibdelosporangium philippinense]MCE7009423.1 LysR family transcriptional regulator [Kibdelosporangium philippinense]